MTLWGGIVDHLTFRQVTWHCRARITPTIKERAVPTNFLSEEQRRRFGHFTEDPDEGQLAGSFLLDQTARRRAMAARGPGYLVLSSNERGQSDTCL